RGLVHQRGRPARLRGGARSAAGGAARGVSVIALRPLWARIGAAARRPAPVSDAVFVALFAAAVRGAWVAWAAGRFPPAEDGHFYHVVAQRIAAGDGYTWLWPDGAVTYAAHYPIGYPALAGALYSVFGAR